MEQDFGINQDNFPWLTWATASWNVGESRKANGAGLANIIC